MDARSSGRIKVPGREKRVRILYKKRKNERFEETWDRRKPPRNILKEYWWQGRDRQYHKRKEKVCCVRAEASQAIEVAKILTSDQGGEVSQMWIELSGPWGLE